MKNSIDRRLWLRQTSLALAGLSLSSNLLATERSDFFIPGSPILLNSNENAYGPSPLARKAMMDSYLSSNRYPDDYLPLLKKKIAAHWKVDEENILLGAGSSDIIGLACQHVSKSKGNIITADPSYRVWNNQAASFGLGFKRIALNGDRKIDLQNMVNQIDNDTRMLYICNPNNPTGTFVPIRQLSDQVLNASKKTFVFIDEAYTEYAELESLAPMAVMNKNIVVAKTFSKIYGLAGARVGYAIAHPETIRALTSFQPWPDAGVSVVSASAATAALDDQTFIKNCREKIGNAKENCYTAFKQFSLDYIPSSTNFILFNIDKIKGDLSQKMQAKNIYVQSRDHFGGKWCRVSLGTIEEMQVFVKALKEIVS